MTLTKEKLDELEGLLDGPFCPLIAALVDNAKELIAAARERDELQRQNAEFLEMLREFEFVADDTGCEYCAFCGVGSGRKHSSGCEMARVLSK